MNHIFYVSWCQSDLLWCQIFWVFGMSIFEKLQFYTYMDNMHIKWKLKSFWIYICHQKVQLGMKTFWKKMNFKIFCFDFQRKKKFKHKFFNIPFSIPPKFYFGMIFNTKKEFTWRIDNPYFIIDKIVSVWKCFGHFVPPLSLFRVKFGSNIDSLRTSNKPYNQEIPKYSKNLI